MSLNLSDPSALSQPTRVGARLNPTVAAFMRRGLDSGLAKRLHREGLTLSALKQRTGEALALLGLTPVQVAAVHSSGRADIPFDTLAKVLWASRWTCCVCRRPGLAVIVHHIQPWAKTRDHAPGNLVVLCLEHHAQAHRRGDLERNLDAPLLTDHKARWEAEVSTMDARAVLDASVLPDHHWLWFNHLRLFDLARRLDIPYVRWTSRIMAQEKGYVDDQGLPRTNDKPFVASGGDGNYLLDYLRSVLHAVLRQTALFNISDDLDRGLLSRIVQPGHTVLVQGRHVFKPLSHIERGPGQAVEVRRRANGVEVAFTIDRWEAVATSSWSSWLAGSQNVASIVRIIDVEMRDDILHIRATGLAIGLALQGLATRSYLSLPAGVTDRPDLDPPGWLEADTDDG